MLGLRPAGGYLDIQRISQTWIKSLEAIHSLVRDSKRCRTVYTVQSMCASTRPAVIATVRGSAAEALERLAMGVLLACRAHTEFLQLAGVCKPLPFSGAHSELWRGLVRVRQGSCGP